VLGDEVSQAGSWVGAERMRFDFRSPTGGLTPEQRREVVARVNEMIRADHHLETKIMTPAQAASSGAISMAGEQYGDSIRVVHAGPAIEFCGGTHAITTGELGMFVMLSQSSIGSGIRRIEAVVSKAAERYVVEQQDLLANLASKLAVAPTEVGERVERLHAELREAQGDLGAARAKSAAADAQRYLGEAKDIHGKPFVAQVVRANADELKLLANAICSRMPQGGVIALAGVEREVVSLLVTVSEDLVEQGVHAGNLLKLAATHVEGRGGGQAAQAQGGGKKPAGAQAAIDAVRNAVFS
jgi:alanyl-tRNA synthetase